MREYDGDVCSPGGGRGGGGKWEPVEPGYGNMECRWSETEKRNI